MHELNPDTFKACGVALRETFSSGKMTERRHKPPLVSAHRALLTLIHDLSSVRPSTEATRLTGKARNALTDLLPERDFSIREAIIAELAYICETIARIKFNTHIEEVSRQGMRRMSEAKLFCQVFADELGTVRVRKKRPKKRRRTKRTRT